MAKITPAMIAAARGADPAFAGVSDVAMRAALEPHWALCRQGRGRPSPALVSRIVTYKPKPPGPVRIVTALQAALAFPGAMTAGDGGRTVSVVC